MNKLILLALGAASAFAAIPRPAPVATHAVLFFETPASFAERTGPKSADYWKKWGTYIQGLYASGKIISGGAMDEPKNGVRLPASAPGGPRPSGVLLLAADRAEAIRMAEGAPCVKDGGAVEVRPLLPMSMEAGR